MIHIQYIIPNNCVFEINSYKITSSLDLYFAKDSFANESADKFSIIIIGRNVILSVLWLDSGYSLLPSGVPLGYDDMDIVLFNSY